MQRGRRALNSFTEPFDLNQGSLPENASMDHSTPWNNMMSPVESRLSNYMLGATDVNASCSNAADGDDSAQNFSGWDFGESSSTANDMQDGIRGPDSKTRLGLDAGSEDWSFPPSNSNITRSLVAGNLGSNSASMDLNLNEGQSWNHDFHRGPGAALPHDLYKSGHSAIEQNPNPTFYPSSSNAGTFSGRSSTSSENYEPSFGSWGTSCKRKALEGTSRQLYPGGSSSSSQNPMEKNMMQHTPHGCYNASGNLSISSGAVNLSSRNLVEQAHPSIGLGSSRIAPTPFPSSSVPGFQESSSRHFAVRLNHGRHDPSPYDYDTPRSSSMRSSGVYSSHHSRPTQPMNQNEARGTQPHLMPVNEARGTQSYPWEGSLSSRGGSSSSSFLLSGERGSEEIHVRDSRRNNLDYPMTVSAPETRNALPDQIDWSFAPGTSATSRNHPSGSRVGPTLGGRTYSGAWMPHLNPTSQNHQRMSESLPWIPNYRAESETGNRRSHFSVLPSSASPSLDEAANNISRHHLEQPRSAAHLLDIPGDDVNSWRSLAAVEGRHRLIRQVLSAMRRRVHLQAEDYMLIDPFINGFAELNDRHRDLRLDVDNMSYEELLALEEQIGNVSTGLSEEQIRCSMKQRKHEARRRSSPNMEPCCICQEDYVSGEDIGILECGHEFHTSCIKQWLTLKNICPICKTTALET